MELKKYFYLLSIKKDKYKMVNDNGVEVFNNYKYKFGVTNNYKKRFENISKRYVIEPIQIWSVEKAQAMHIECAVKEICLPRHQKIEYQNKLDLNLFYGVVDSGNWKVKELIK